MTERLHPPMAVLPILFVVAACSDGARLDSGSDPASTDPCAGVDCRVAPAAACVDGDSRVRFDGGRCVDGACAWDSHVDTCDAPPEPTCIDGTTLKVMPGLALDENCPVLEAARGPLGTKCKARRGFRKKSHQRYEDRYEN